MSGRKLKLVQFKYCRIGLYLEGILLKRKVALNHSER